MDEGWGGEVEVGTSEWAQRGKEGARGVEGRERGEGSAKGRLRPQSKSGENMD